MCQEMKNGRGRSVYYCMYACGITAGTVNNTSCHYTCTCCKVFPHEPILTSVLAVAFDLHTSNMKLATCLKAQTVQVPVSLDCAVPSGTLMISYWIYFQIAFFHRVHGLNFFFSLFNNNLAVWSSVGITMRTWKDVCACVRGGLHVCCCNCTLSIKLLPLCLLNMFLCSKRLYVTQILKRGNREMIYGLGCVCSFPCFALHAQSRTTVLFW